MKLIKFSATLLEKFKEIYINLQYILLQVSLKLMSMYTRVFQWCAVALILYTVHLEIEFYNCLPLLLNCFFRWQELKEVGRSLPKSAKKLQVLKQGFSLEIHRKWHSMKTPSSKSLSTHPGVSLCCQLPSCDSFISIQVFHVVYDCTAAFWNSNVVTY